MESPFLAFKFWNPARTSPLSVSNRKQRRRPLAAAAAAARPQALELDEGSDGAIDGGHWMKGFQFALAGPIYAGTNEIQRNIIAERVLGLPRK